jgi:hypothetical protein
MCSGWARTYKGSRGASSRDLRKVKGCPIPTEELCGQEEARRKLQSGRLCLPQGFTYPRNSKISSAQEVGPSVHWTVQSAEESWSSSIPVGATRRNVRYTSNVSCLLVTKVFESVGRGNRFAASSYVPGSASQDFGLGGQKDEDIRSVSVQSPMEQTRSRRSHMGTRGHVEERVSPPVRELAESRGRDSF